MSTHFSIKQFTGNIHCPKIFPSLLSTVKNANRQKHRSSVQNVHPWIQASYQCVCKFNGCMHFNHVLNMYWICIYLMHDWNHAHKLWVLFASYDQRAQTNTTMMMHMEFDRQHTQTHTISHMWTRVENDAAAAAVIDLLMSRSECMRCARLRLRATINQYIVAIDVYKIVYHRAVKRWLSRDANGWWDHISRLWAMRDSVFRMVTVLWLSLLLCVTAQQRVIRYPTTRHTAVQEDRTIVQCQGCGITFIISI